MNELTLEVVSGDGLSSVLEDLAALRITVFREFPYLYQGTHDYEARYLRSYADAAWGVVVVARDRHRIIGASTAMPLARHSDGVAETMARAGYTIDQVYYLGESVLLPPYRGRGLGHRFFEQREDAARRFGFLHAAFCAVERPIDHPLRPPDYRPLDGFWQRRGYRKRPEIGVEFSWPDLGEVEESKKPMVFWTKELR